MSSLVMSWADILFLISGPIVGHYVLTIEQMMPVSHPKHFITVWYIGVINLLTYVKVPLYGLLGGIWVTYFAYLLFN